MSHTCQNPECRKPLLGRADRRWCSDACKKRGQRSGIILVPAPDIELEEHLIEVGELDPRQRHDPSAVLAAAQRWMFRPKARKSAA